MGYLAQTVLSNTTAQNAIGTLVHTLTVVPNGWTLTQFVQNLNSPDFYLDDLVKLDFLQSSLAFVKAIDEAAAAMFALQHEVMAGQKIPIQGTGREAYRS